MKVIASDTTTVIYYPDTITDNLIKDMMYACTGGRYDYGSIDSICLKVQYNESFRDVIFYALYSNGESNSYQIMSHHFDAINSENIFDEYLSICLDFYIKNQFL